MQNYIICTDTACDIRPELLNEWGIPFFNMTYKFEGEDREYIESDMEIGAFYDKMRNGAIVKTAAINPDSFKNGFEDFLKQGKDVLYLSFSSGLSTTFNSARIAAAELADAYPDRQIIVVDTLCASAGQGLLLYFAVKKQNEGATIKENADYINSLIPNLCHLFTVDDLVYLKRGGRISSAVAFVGGVLGIKPILYVDDEGHLVSRGKVRGRKAALNSFIERYEETAIDKKGTVFISHGDCESDANYLKSEFKSKFGAKVEIITQIGPVIGAHSGPGTLAVFFLGKEK